jgi:hypothetical protein
MRDLPTADCAEVEVSGAHRGDFESSSVGELGEEFYAPEPAAYAGGQVPHPDGAIGAAGVNGL